MKMPSIFKPKSLTTGVFLAGVILVPLLSHGCSVKGSSPDSGQTVSSSVSHQSS